MFPYVLGQYSLPRWTPYAEAIAKHYRSVTQFFINVPTMLTDAADERKTVIVPAHQYDRLFFAAHVQACVSGGSGGDVVITEDGDTVVTEDAADDVVTEGGGSSPSMCGGQQVYLQVWDKRSGIKWASIAPIDSAPLSAYGGSSEEAMPLIKLPEAFFLPKNVDLRFDFSVLNSTLDGGRVTWVGVQLADGQVPEYVDVEGLGSVKVGSRIPWFAVIGLGRQQINLSSAFQFNSGRRFVAYTMPTECDVEVHDIHGQFTLDVEELGGNADLIQFALAETGQRKLWTQSFTPSRNFLGDTTKAFPVMPLPVPYLLKRGRKLELSAFNNVSGVGVADGFVVIRGVQRCSL